MVFAKRINETLRVRAWSFAEHKDMLKWMWIIIEQQFISAAQILHFFNILFFCVKILRSSKASKFSSNSILTGKKLEEKHESFLRSNINQRKKKKNLISSHKKMKTYINFTVSRSTIVGSIYRKTENYEIVCLFRIPSHMTEHDVDVCLAVLR